MTLFYESVARVLILHIEAEARQTQAGCRSMEAHSLFCQYIVRFRSGRESTIISFCKALIGPLPLFLTILIASLVCKYYKMKQLGLFMCILLMLYIPFQLTEDGFLA